MKSNWSD